MDTKIIQHIHEDITKESKKKKKTNPKPSVYTWGSSLLGKKDFRKKKILLCIFSPGGCIKVKNQINTILVLDGGDSMRTSVL